MPLREPAAFVFDLVSACRRIRQYTEGYTREAFLGDLKTRDAVERQLSIAGEAVVQLRGIDRPLAERLGPIDQIAGFRNILVHAYFRIDPGEVWSIVAEHVPPLLIAAEALLATMPPPQMPESE